MRFFVGTYTSLGGPGVCLMEAKDGRLESLNTCRVIDNPNYLILSEDRKTLYASATMGPKGKGAVASFRVDDGRLTPLCIQPAGGDDVCHVALSADEDFLYSANYQSGSVSVFPVHDGYVFPHEQMFRHKGGSGVVADRQETAHTHQCSFRPGTQELFVCDLGKDEIFIYTQGEESGLLIHTSSIRVPAGCGPRHILFINENRFLLACELSNTVLRYEMHKDEWQLMQTLSTLPEGETAPNTVAAIRRFGDRVFVSNRGFNSVAEYIIKPGGALALEAIHSIKGDCPRDILPFTAKDILCANQVSGTVEWLSGGSTIAEISVPGAVCLLAYD